MAYELWDKDSRNIVGDYPTEDEALAVVGNAMRTHGRDAVVSLVLAYEDRRGRTRLIAMGDELVERACQLADEAESAQTELSANRASVSQER